MIVVRVELHSAITGRVTELARAVIDNVGGTETKGDYRCRAYRKGSTLHPLESGVIREGSVIGHQRLAKPVWCLVLKALTAMNYGD